MIKMNKIQNIRIVFPALLCFTVNWSLQGQVPLNTPAAYEQMKQKSQWLQTTNAAGLLLDNPVDYTELSASYDSYKGDFHRPQQGESGNDLAFDVEGAVKLKKLYTWGQFNYTRSTAEDVQYNASIIDPFRGMPYLVADTNRSEWRYQVYDLAFRVATPQTAGNLSFGLEGAYQVISGAKQRDIRTESYFYRIRVRPGLVYSVNNRHHVGINLDYYNKKEESNMSNVNVYNDQEYYVLYGLGAATRGLGSGQTINYEGNSVGGGLQYNFQGALNLLLSSTYNYEVEDAEVSFTYPREAFTVKYRIWDSKLQLSKAYDRLTHFAEAGFTNREADGIEYVTVYDNTEAQEGYVTLHSDIRSKYTTRQARFDYDLAIGDEAEYDWKLGAGVRYDLKKDRYLTPYSEKKAENIAFQVRAKKNFKLSGSELDKRILLAADYSLSNNLSGHYEYNGTHPDYPVVTKLEQTDTNYLNSGYYSLAGALTYSQKLKQDLLANLFVKADYRFVKADDNGFDDRQLFKISVGCNF
jgi:hypothetical protein